MFLQYFPILCPIHAGPSFHQGLHTKNGLDLLLAYGHGPVGLVRPYLLFLSSSLTNQLVDYFDHVKFEQMPWENNSATDEVAKLASTENTPKKSRLYMEIQTIPSTEGLQAFLVQQSST